MHAISQSKLFLFYFPQQGPIALQAERKGKRREGPQLQRIEHAFRPIQPSPKQSTSNSDLSSRPPISPQASYPKLKLLIAQTSRGQLVCTFEMVGIVDENKYIYIEHEVIRFLSEDSIQST